ncbi:MAG TPA: efflux RND transporter periplasmic adaptor subunit [Burkholderiales bacterium]|nr:efflux RND transporter periplasmic adaptor subunit [Burkholderiales bacterium]
MTATHPFHRRGVCANAALVLIAASALSACSADRAPAGSESAHAARQAVPVIVAEAVRKTVPLRVQGIGNVESPTTVALKSRVDGQIVNVGFRDGADVRKGQMLFQIDARPAIAQLEQAQAKLASDRAQRKRAREQDTRYKDLLNKKFISADAYEQYKTNLDSAQAIVDADQAVVDNARLQVAYATIRAPISGRAGRIMIQQGNLVKANDTNPLVVINQLSPIYVNFAVPEQYLPQIRAALRAGPAAVDISANGADGKARHVPGTLAFIDNAVDATTGTIKLRASAPNKDAELWPGQFVHATLTLGEQAGAVVVPSAAVQSGPDGAYVFIVDGAAHAQMRKVAIERTAGDDTVIAKGLAGGEKVVVDGQSRLLPGIPVTVKTAGSGAS